MSNIVQGIAKDLKAIPENLKAKLKGYKAICTGSGAFREVRPPFCLKFPAQYGRKGRGRNRYGR